MVFKPNQLEFTQKVKISDLFDIGTALSASLDGSALIISCTQGFLRLEFYQEDILRVSMNLNKKPTNDTSIAVCVKPKEITTDFNHEANIVFKSNRLKAVIEKNPVRLAIYDNDRLLVSETSLGLCHDGNRKVTCYKDIDPKDHYYGFGEKTGHLDKKGTKMEFYNTDVLPHTPDVDRMYQSIPFFLTLRLGACFGIFLDFPGLTTFDFKSSKDYYSFSADNDQLDYYVFAGPKPKDVLNQYTYLTGRMPLPPKWALGYQQSRYSYETEAEVRELAKTFKSKDIPLDVIYLDIHYMDGYRVFSFDQNRFPSYRSLVSDIKKQGIHLVPIVDPGVKVDAEYPIYCDGIKNDVFCSLLDGSLFYGRVWAGKSVFPDFTSKKARTWWQEQNRFYTDLGIEGLWNDMNEPSIFGEQKPVDMDPQVIHDNDGNPKTHRSLHNIYGMQMAASTHSALLEQTTKRPFVLTRAGYAGIQRYAAVWTGDNSSHFEHLQMSLPMCMNLGLSGVPFVGADVGGFMYDTQPELLTRWTQAAAFIPFFRNHSTLGTIHQEPWAFDPKTEAIIRKFIKLRYTWLPHWYNLFREAATTGSPIMRPLIYEYPDDQNVINLNNEFLVGPDVLVAPITEPGVNHRAVYLPGGIWYNYFTGECYSGNRYILAQGNLDSLPLYIRGGSFIALTKPKQNTTLPDKLLELHFFWAEGKDFSYTLYDDDGSSHRYLEGEYFEATIEAHCLSEELNLKIKTQHQGYRPSWERVVFVVHGMPKELVFRINGRELTLTQDSSLINWDSKSTSFSFEL